MTDQADVPRVLIIEDDTGVSELLCRFFGENRIKVTSAPSGKAGLGALEEQAFDLVLLDLVMPGMSGFDVLVQIREKYSRIDLPVIIMTGDRDKGSVLKGFDLGANDYVFKPFDLRVLLARVSSQLEMKSHSGGHSQGNVDVDGVQVGSMFGNFEVLELLGAGGMGTVFKVKDRVLDRIVALKTLLPSLELDDRQIKRFRQEAKIIAKLNHPNIVKILEIGERPQNYFTMEFVSGMSLNDHFKQAHLPIPQKLEIIAKVASALDAAHQKKIIHRDVKPSNIMINAQGEPKLLDFGTAKVLESKSNLTLTVDIVGTPVYMAPEQLDSDIGCIDGITDVYGLGVVLYEVLTGNPPFVGPTMKVIWQVAHHDPVPPSLVNGDIPSALEKVCLRAIHKQKEKRFQSAKELETALMACVC